MKKHALAAAACLSLLSSAAFAQTAATNSGAFGAQMNNQYGVGNVASNAGVVSQTAIAGTTGPAPAAHYDRVGGVLTSLFGTEPLVDNEVVVGTQLNIQNGVGNSASNAMAVGQTGLAGGAPAGGGLVNNGVAVGTQLNVQNGYGNTASNTGTFNQLGGSFGASPFGGLVNNQVAVGTQVNVQNGDYNSASNALGFNQVAGPGN